MSAYASVDNQKGFHIMTSRGCPDRCYFCSSTVFFGHKFRQMSPERVGEMVDYLVEVRLKKGRLFLIGVGGGAGHASHAVNDFRKICKIKTI